MKPLDRKTKLAIAVACIALAVGLAFFRANGTAAINGRSDLAFYVDEVTGDEHTDSVNQIPPLPGKDGRPNVVRAIKATYDGKNVFTLYYLKYSDEAQADLKAIPPQDPTDPRPSPAMDIMARGEMVRLPAPGSPWVPSTNDEAFAIRKIPTGPDGKPATIVTPAK